MRRIASLDKSSVATRQALLCNFANDLNGMGIFGPPETQFIVAIYTQLGYLMYVAFMMLDDWIENLRRVL